LYDQFTSSALVHPSALNRFTIVVQVLLLAFHPCTNRMGLCVITGGGGGGGGAGFRALSALPAIGPVGASMQAASANSAASGNIRVDRRSVWLMKKSK